MIHLERLDLTIPDDFPLVHLFYVDRVQPLGLKSVKVSNGFNQCGESSGVHAGDYSTRPFAQNQWGNSNPATTQPANGQWQLATGNWLIPANSAHRRTAGLMHYIRVARARVIMIETSGVALMSDNEISGCSF